MNAGEKRTAFRSLWHRLPLVMVQLKFPEKLSFRSAAFRARDLLSRCWQQADSSPMELASE
jgi:hypothetical protein